MLQVLLLVTYALIASQLLHNSTGNQDRPEAGGEPKAAAESVSGKDPGQVLGSGPGTMLDAQEILCLVGKDSSSRRSSNSRGFPHKYSIN